MNTLPRAHLDINLDTASGKTFSVYSGQTVKLISGHGHVVKVKTAKPDTVERVWADIKPAADGSSVLLEIIEPGKYKIPFSLGIMHAIPDGSFLLQVKQIDR